MSSLILPAINLGILLAILAWKLRAPIKGFVNDRHATMREDIGKTARDLQGARAKHAEFVSRLAAMEGEVAQLRQQALQDAESMRARIRAEAQRLSQVIVADARTASEALFADFRAQLRSELGVRVLDRAEEILRERLTGDDRARIRKDFSRQVEAIQ